MDRETDRAGRIAFRCYLCARPLLKIFLQPLMESWSGSFSHHQQAMLPLPDARQGGKKKIATKAKRRRARGRQRDGGGAGKTATSTSH